MINKVEICGVNTSKLPTLSRERKAELFDKIKKGDIEAREEFVQGNLRLVLSVIQRFNNRGESVDDLFQVGCIGLIKAIDNFDLSQNVQFSTYAVPKIAGEIRRFLRDDGAVKVSRGIKERAIAVKTVRNQLLTTLGREPTIQEIAEQTELTPEEIAIAESATACVESIHQTNGEDGFTLENVLTDTKSEDYYIEQMALHQAIERLPEREKMVIHLRFFHGLTQERVSKILEVSQVQVSRIEKKALSHLRNWME